MAGRRITRRAALGLAAGGVAGALAGCGGSPRPHPALSDDSQPVQVIRTPGIATDSSPTPSPTPTATPSPSPTPQAFPPGIETRLLLPDSPWESELSIRHSGVTGPVVLVLGGVHGNEPGGWMAAEELSALQPVAGSLLVLPRANQLAIVDFVRTYDDLGDLNRLYPGNLLSQLPMERMAGEIVRLASEFSVDTVLDLHESWAFYNTRTQDGTAFLGQTITAGVGPRNPTFSQELTARANAIIGIERDLMVVRDGASFRRPDPATPTTGTGRGRSSLSLGGHLPGLTPLLVEMGQEDQSIERRTQLHLIVAREALSMLGVA
jgi:hypothetical protein